MSIADLIRKRGTGEPANANPAKVANDEHIKAEPLARLATLSLANPPKEPDGGLTQNEEALILAWLTFVNETDSEMIADVLARCRGDQSTRAYFLNCANTPEVIAMQATLAAKEASAQKAKIREFEAGLSQGRADRVAQLCNAFYNHIMGPGKATNCCYAPANRYCSEGKRLHDTYCGAVS